MSCLVLVFPLCTLCIDNADCDGWVMSVVWRMIAFQKTSSTGSWLWGGEPPAALTCDIKMSAWKRHEGCRHRHCVLGLAANRTKWRSALKQHLKTGEYKLMDAAADKRSSRKEGSNYIRPETTHRCDVCSKDCHSHIGLFSHNSTGILCFFTEQIATEAFSTGFVLLRYPL